MHLASIREFLKTYCPVMFHKTSGLLVFLTALYAPYALHLTFELKLHQLSIC